jgi:hypothetical protein
VAGLTFGFLVFNLAEPPRHKTDPCCSLGHEEEGAEGGHPSSNPMYEAPSVSELQTGKK